jgi:hypothetical protein
MYLAFVRDVLIRNTRALNWMNNVTLRERTVKLTGAPIILSFGLTLIRINAIIPAHAKQGIQ